MARFVEVAFRRAGQLFLFNAGELELSVEDRVIVDTEHGLALGTVKSPIKTKLSEPVAGIKIFRVLRVATEQDIEREKRHKIREDEAFQFCRKRIAEHKLPMKLVRAEYLYSGSKLLFYFSAEGRIDFRLLVRDLARYFRMRIEMRQIGIRDSSKLIGGLGPCGKELCCSRFLRNFNPVSIRMAKDQNLTLNPQKVSGTCGRLMCCLSYEQDMYQSIREFLPRVGRLVSTPDGKGRLREVMPLSNSVIVVFWEEEPPIERTYNVDQLNDYYGISDKIAALTFPPPTSDSFRDKKRTRRGIEPLMEPKNRVSLRERYAPETKSSFHPTENTSSDTKHESFHHSKNDAHSSSEKDNSGELDALLHEERKKESVQTVEHYFGRRKTVVRDSSQSFSKSREKKSIKQHSVSSQQIDASMIDQSEKDRALAEFRSKLPMDDSDTLENQKEKNRTHRDSQENRKNRTHRDSQENRDNKKENKNNRDNRKNNKKENRNNRDNRSIQDNRMNNDKRKKSSNVSKEGTKDSFSSNESDHKVTTVLGKNKKDSSRTNGRADIDSSSPKVIDVESQNKHNKENELITSKDKNNHLIKEKSNRNKSRQKRRRRKKKKN